MEEKDYENLQMIREMKTTRNSLQMTQEQFGAHLGVTRNTVARWENGRLKIPRVVELAVFALRTISPKQFQVFRESRDTFIHIAKQETQSDNSKNKKAVN